MPKECKAVYNETGFYISGKVSKGLLPGIHVACICLAKSGDAAGGETVKFNRWSNSKITCYCKSVQCNPHE